ncbi:adenylate/guanylate cyclase catalytic domain protein [Trichuris suis]|nr:adenylate/guanylate cyclase catalytic domain protein [Trichuris suis]
MFQHLLAHDVICGLQSLHCRHDLIHGHLRSSCIQIDNNCRAKILVMRLDSMEDSILQRPQGFSQLYLAPEMLRDDAYKPTREADMYSFAIVLHQIVYQKCAFYIEKDEEEMERKYVRIIHPNLITTDNIEKIHKYCQSTLPSDSHFTMYPKEEEAKFIVDKIIDGYTIRPSVMPTEDDMEELLNVMQCCWQEDPANRMDSSCALMRITLAMRGRSNDTFYNIAKRVSAGAGDLESILADRSERIRRQRDHCLRLLSGIMPLSIASSMMSGCKTRISKVELASIYFHGVYNFKKAYTTANEAVRFLDKLYGTCDRIASMYDVTPLHRVNDTLLIASGVLSPCAEHASELAMVAVQLHEAIRNQFPDMLVEIKSGINSGTVVCGVVGTKVPMYAVFGDTVNVASRMYSTSEPGRTQISENTYRLLRKKRRIFNMVKRGPVEVKGKGTMNTYWLRSYRKYLGCVPTDVRLDGIATSAELDIALGDDVHEINIHKDGSSGLSTEESSLPSSTMRSVSKFLSSEVIEPTNGTVERPLTSPLKIELTSKRRHSVQLAGRHSLVIHNMAHHDNYKCSKYGNTFKQTSAAVI